MFKTLCKILCTLAITGSFLAVCGYMLVRHYTVAEAQAVARNITDQALSQEVETPDQEVIALAKVVFDTFQEREPSELLPLRLRPYVTNKRLPDVFKFPEGAIETIVQAGMCDNAVRMLKFILARRGYDSVQWNMVKNGAAHSALLVNLPDGRQGFVDPFYGYAAIENGKLISAQAAQTLVRGG